MVLKPKGAVMLPRRVLTKKNGTYYGYGPSSQEIEVVTSIHPKGKEPVGPVMLFGKRWDMERGSYMYDGIVYLTWKQM